MADPLDAANVDLADIDADTRKPPAGWVAADTGADPDPDDVLDLDVDADS
jgi:hypothetical protein